MVVESARVSWEVVQLGQGLANFLDLVLVAGLRLYKNLIV